MPINKTRFLDSDFVNDHTDHETEYDHDNTASEFITSDSDKDKSESSKCSNLSLSETDNNNNNNNNNNNDEIKDVFKSSMYCKGVEKGLHKTVNDAYNLKTKLCRSQAAIKNKRQMCQKILKHLELKENKCDHHIKQIGYQLSSLEKITNVPYDNHCHINTPNNNICIDDYHNMLYNIIYIFTILSLSFTFLQTIG